MPRPKSPFPKEKVKVSLPQELLARLRLMFFTPDTENMLIRGALSEFVAEAIREKLERLDHAASSKNPSL